MVEKPVINGFKPGGVACHIAAYPVPQPSDPFPAYEALVPRNGKGAAQRPKPKHRHAAADLPVPEPPEHFHAPVAIHVRPVTRGIHPPEIRHDDLREGLIRRRAKKRVFRALRARRPKLYVFCGSGNDPHAYLFL